ncbi:HutD family protein [Flavobacterium sp.]|jgi:environmental stress-induced protein Ves|uniref:HutD family protein n=1 Tax=Flavobacterium sp. TaxID=239 RepID=UPI002A7F6A86|nr:HutD family protein [Flavobacterium sp.]
MNYKIISKNNLKTTTWQGGTTTELYIFPEDTNYQERNFDFRISTAEISLEQSSFTPLPNTNRELMLLEGSIEIIHESHYSKKMNKFDIDSFKGDWKTSAKGTCIDFNIMSKEKYNGKIEALNSESKHKRHLNNTSDFLILYIYKGEILVEIENDIIQLVKGNVLVLNKKVNIEINFTKTSEIIVSKIDIK